ncbi:T3SS effector HopA1 family protein [Planobispora siamensis]|uniref:T3SS effector HopA1 family protein n=1 Tax=Planobispora siamensis TaxID=936338 RepID=UPI001951DBDD|nr:T3SS effector HopA1 family protein [Planobispora siamensis]
MSKSAIRVATGRRPAFRPGMSDQERYALNRQAARQTLDQIYDQYYDAATGLKRPPDALQKSIYDLMGKASSGYMREPITRDQWLAFKTQPNATVVGQRVKKHRGAWRRYRQELADYEGGWKKFDPLTDPPARPRGPENDDESVTRGDYFRVYNQNGGSDQGRRMRRIIVNVNSQEAGLRVARALNGLFTDPVTKKHFRQYKIYLSTTAGTGAELVKHDKLVLYYGLADPDDTSSDPVGDKIVSAIDGAIRPEDVGEGFAPFYSIVSPGVAWAEEPKTFVSALKRSFTKTRAEIIAQVVRANPLIRDKDEFERLVYAALEQARVDPERPHRHIPDMPLESGK